MHGFLASALAAAFAAAAVPAVATTPQWAALIALDDGLDVYSVRIAADSEDACFAQIASQRGALIVEPCQPTASAITDPNDANKSIRPRRIQPSPASGSGSSDAGSGGNTGSGSSGGGAGGGGGGGW
jgi:uncharacterized membrane protein YgcG